MQFVYPYFLLALISISIPVIIHLFNFRKYKKLEFSNISFLKNIQEETQSKSQLKHLLILACRILTLIFLVLLFAQPFLPSNNSKSQSGQAVVSIYIDNSFSMDATERNGTLLDEAKKKAEEIIKAYNPSDKFQLLTNEFAGKQQRLLSSEEFYDELSQLKICSFSRPFEEIISRQTDALNSTSGNNKSAYIISDFQKNMFNESSTLNDSGVFVHLIQITSSVKKNIFIDTCYFTSPSRKINEPDELIVKIRNNGEEKIENNPIKLFINGQQKALRSFSVDANSSILVSMTFSHNESGIKNAYLEIIDNPITYDDRLYFSYEIIEKYQILVINGSKASRYLKSLFEKDSVVQFSEIKEDNVDYSELKNYRLIVLNEMDKISSGLCLELKKYLENSGHLLLIPSTNSDLVSYNVFLSEIGSDPLSSKDSSKQKVNVINYQHPLFQGVFDKNVKKEISTDLPNINNHYVLKSRTSSRNELLIQLQNGDPFLVSSRCFNGLIYLLTVSLNNDYGNFAKHALFVPVMYQMLFQSQQTGNLYQLIGKDNFVQINQKLNRENTLKLKKSDSKFEFIPEIRNAEGKTLVYFNNEVTVEGNYAVYQNNEAISGISFNYNRSESELSYFTSDELKDRVNKLKGKIDVIENSKQDMTYTIKQLNEGYPLWKYCLIFALIFMLAEVLIIRYYK